MDFDDLTLGFSQVLMCIGFIGIALFLTLLCLFFLSNLLDFINVSFADSKIKLVISVALWMTTFLIPGFAHPGSYSIKNKQIRADIELTRKSMRFMDKDDWFSVRITNLLKVLLKSFFILVFVALPIISGCMGVASRLYLEGSFQILFNFKYYSLILNLIFAIIFIIRINKEEESSWEGIVFGILLFFSTISLIILWILPSLSPYRLVTYITTSTNATITGAGQIKT